MEIQSDFKWNMYLQKYCLSISFAQNLRRMNSVIRDLPWRFYFLFFFLPDLETQSTKNTSLFYSSVVSYGWGLPHRWNQSQWPVCIMIQYYFILILNSYAVLTLGDIWETADKWFSDKDKDIEEKGERGGGQMQCEGSNCYCRIQCERSSLLMLCTVFCLAIWIDSFPFSFPFLLSPLAYSQFPHHFSPFLLITFFFFRLRRSDPSHLSLSLLILYSIAV